MEVLSLLLTYPTPLLQLLRPQAHLTLTTPPSFSPITHACNRDAAASVVVPKSTIPQTHRLLLDLRRRLRLHRQLHGPVSERLLTFGFLTSYLFW